MLEQKTKNLKLPKAEASVAVNIKQINQFPAVALEAAVAAKSAAAVVGPSISHQAVDTKRKIQNVKFINQLQSIGSSVINNQSVSQSEATVRQSVNILF